ncbi:MAG: sensor histidine kinase [Salibacteraceae bacterium]|nr:sensor histidine kinase [Salibacteraceae bacterium]
MITNFWNKKLLIVLLYVGFVLNSFAQLSEDDLKPILLEDYTAEYNIGVQLQIYQDYYRQETLEHVAANGTFKANTKKAGNEGNSGAKIWCRFKLKAADAGLWYLELGNPLLSDIELHAIGSNGSVKRIDYSAYKAFSERHLANNLFFFPLDFEANEEKTIYISLVATYPLDFPLSIMQAETIIEKNHKLDVFHGIFFGFIIVMALYNFFLYFSVKEELYLYYVFCIVGMGLMIAHFTGYAFNFLWPFFPTMNQWPAIMPCIGITFAFLFTTKFLQLSKNMPKLDKILKMMLAILLLSIPLNLVHVLGVFESPLPIIIAAIIIQLIAVILDVTLFIAGLTMYRRGFSPAKYFLLAWSSLLIGALIYVFLNLGILEPSFFTKFALEMGVGIEITFLSFALADRINVYKREKAQAQNDAFAALQENERLIVEQNKMLEEKVTERTRELDARNNELTETINELKETQQKLVESEKMASLGTLVAGIAHEINTPVGIGVTAASGFIDKTESLAGKLKADTMSKKDLMEYLNFMYKSSKLVLSNLQRTAELVKSFKQVSVDQSVEEKRTFALGSYLKDIVNTIAPKFKGQEVDFKFDCPDNIMLHSYPGAFAQIITNFMVNSSLHAFEESNAGTIILTGRLTENEVILSYSDNGKGMSKEITERIFDPFFTTNKQHGTGLGMHIVYNLVTQKLMGTIELISSPGNGVTFTISLPKSEVIEQH